MIIIASTMVRFRRAAERLLKGKTRDFIFHPERFTGRPLRRAVPWVMCFNLPVSDASRCAKIMQATAKLNVGCKRPVYVLKIFFRKQDERIGGRIQLCQIARGAIDILGMRDHQYFVIGRPATTIREVKGPRIYVVASKIHPRKLVAANLSFDYLKLSKYAEFVESKSALSEEPRRTFNNTLRRRGRYVKHIHWLSDIAWKKEDIFSAVMSAIKCSFASLKSRNPQHAWKRFKAEIGRSGLEVEKTERSIKISNPVNGIELLFKEGSEIYKQIVHIRAGRKDSN